MRAIRLTRGFSAAVDDADFDWLSRFTWHAAESNGRFYAVRTLTEAGRKRRIKMHREIMAAPDGLVVDHIDGNPLNNQRSNLRVCSQSRNVRNSVKTVGKGAYLCGTTGMFHARLSFETKRYHVGRFPTQEAALAAVEEGRRLLDGGEAPDAVVAKLRTRGKAMSIAAMLAGTAPAPLLSQETA